MGASHRHLPASLYLDEAFLAYVLKGEFRITWRHSYVIIDIRPGKGKDLCWRLSMRKNVAGKSSFSADQSTIISNDVLLRSMADVCAIYFEHAQNPGRLFVGVSGYPGSGKSTLAKDLCEQLLKTGKHPVLIRQDDFRIEKNARVSDTGEFLHRELPFINQWHNWRELSALLTDIKHCRPPKTFHARSYSPQTKERTDETLYFVKSEVPVIVIIEGAFIFDLGKRNIYNIPRDAIWAMLDLTFFLFRNDPDRFDGTFFWNELKRRKGVEGSDERESRKTSIYIEELQKCNEHAIRAWKRADYFLDNGNFATPELRRNHDQEFFGFQ